MKLLRIRLAFVVALALCAAYASPASQSLTLSINGLLADERLKHGIQGVVVESLSTGETLYQRNADTVFIPASNFKLLVSAAILDRLGPSHTFRTRVYRTGQLLPDGTLQGDLGLSGGGDPVLSTADLAAMAESVAELGVRRVTGGIAGDDTRFDDVRLGEGWAWSDEPYYYSAEISALDLDENVVKVYVTPGSGVGKPAQVRLDPPTAYMRVDNTALTSAAASSDTLTVDRDHGKNVIRVRGSVLMDRKTADPVEEISVVNPTLYAASTFRQKLIAAGVKVDGRAFPYARPQGAVLVTEHTSPPLGDLMPLLLKPSDNLMAEIFLKNLGADAYGKGTAETGAKAEMEFLKKAGLDLGALSIVDGSGLSRRDYITPENLVTLLRYMWNHRYAKIYVDSLPVAGKDGTLRRRMVNSPAAGRVRAKTGYVSRVSCLSGYVTTKTGEPLVFSIMMNGHLCSATEARSIQDAICDALVGYLPDPAANK